MTPTARATSQAARKVRLVARALGVNSSRIAGMIVKGDAAMAIASGTTSAVIASMGASCRVRITVGFGGSSELGS